MVDNRRAGASTQAIGLKKRFEAWLAHHQQVAIETLIRLLQNPFSSVLTWLVIAISLTLPGALWMGLDNTTQLSNQFQASGRITLYLDQSSTIEEGNALVQRLKRLDNVVNTEFIDADTALAEFRESSGLQSALDFLPNNPLPATVYVEPPLGLDTEQLQSLLAKLKDQHIVDSVELDIAWVERLHSILSLAERTVLVLGSLLALAIVLVVGNTIRLAIAARVDEIRVVKLVGGTNAWVRRPFLYTGLWYGLIGGLFAWLLLIACWAILRGPAADLAMLYGSHFRLKPLSASAAMVILASAMLLGWLGAWWSVSRHLGDIEP